MNFEDGTLKAESAAELLPHVDDRDLNPSSDELAFVFGDFVFGESVIEGVDKRMFGSEIETGQNTLLYFFTLFCCVCVRAFADNLCFNNHNFVFLNLKREQAAPHACTVLPAQVVKTARYSPAVYGYFWCPVVILFRRGVFLWGTPFDGFLLGHPRRKQLTGKDWLPLILPCPRELCGWNCCFLLDHPRRKR